MAMELELKRRIGTAIAGVSVLLLLIIFGGREGAALISAVLAVAMVYELVELSFTLPDRKEKRQVLMGITWLVAFINYWIPRSEYELLILSFLGLFSYFLITASRHEGAGFLTHLQELFYGLFGLLYLGFLPLYLPLIRDSANGVHWTLMFLFIVWSVDMGGYFAGKRFGKTKLYPLISPKKTTEGAIGATLAGILVAVIYKLLFFRGLSFGSAVLIPFMIGVVSQIGDLCESFLKRAFNKKDSGSLLPGHGGFLDRFDGVVFSLPVMYGCIRIFG